MKRLFLLAALLVASSCGGGGGESSYTYTVNGKFVSSYVKGLKVCIEGSENCTYTDQLGNFSLKSPTPLPKLSFFIDKVKLGEYALKENWETVNPFKLSSNSLVGDVIAKIIHGAGGDVNGTAQEVDLTGVKAQGPEASVAQEVEDGMPFEIKITDLNGQSHILKVSYSSSSSVVELCDENGENCTPVNYRQWLVLVYLDADNDLNKYAYDDLKEMASVKYSPQVKLVVMADFLDGGKVIAESSDTTGELKETSFEEEPNMGSTITLEDFIKEYEDKYPASKVALIFWNHGDGWRSKMAAYDQTNDSYLWMHKVVDSLKDLNSKGYKVNLIGFDECLMGMVEVFYDAGQFSDAVVASEALEPGEGWNYQKLFSSLVSNPTVDPYQLGNLVVDSYREEYQNYEGDFTMTVLSKEEIGELVNNLNALAQKLNQDTFPLFQSARENAVLVPDGTDGNTLYHVDLYSFVKGLDGDFEEAKKIEEIIDNAYKFTSSDKLKGVAIYFPPTQDASSDFNCYLKESPDGNPNCYGDPLYYNPFAVNLWDDFLKEYYTLEEE
ncbi:clostripain-related cysteine peptidase [Thermovibrio sp.]